MSAIFGFTFHVDRMAEVLTPDIYIYMKFLLHIYIYIYGCCGFPRLIPLVVRYVVVVEFLTSVYQTAQAENST